MERGVAGGEVAIGQMMLQERLRFRKVEGHDVSAHGQVEREEGGVEEDEAREDEGKVCGAVEGAASEAVNRAAGCRDVTRDGKDTTKRSAGLKTLNSSHPLIRSAWRKCMERVYESVFVVESRAGVTCMVR